MSDWLANIVEWLYRAPGWVLVVIASIVIGYCLRAWKSFPNGAIPLMIIVIAACGNMLMCGEEPARETHQSWLTKNFFIGAICGFLAWRLHHKIIAKYEDKIPFLKVLIHSGDTELFTKPVEKEISKP